MKRFFVLALACGLTLTAIPTQSQAGPLKNLITRVRVNKPVVKATQAVVKMPANVVKTAAGCAGGVCPK